MSRISCALVLVVASAALLSEPVQARSFRVSQVPNGGGFGCVLCHTGGNGGSRNPFGMAVEESLVDGNVNWAAIYDLDPDNDGFTNGDELGDPEGTWVIGDPSPRIAPTNPNDPGSFPLPCGNGILEDPEQCDVGDLNGASCESLGFISGDLGCGLDCNYDTSTCNNCGNGFAEGDEECDGDDLAESSCVTLGFGSGELVCTPGCTLDAAACSNCGNDVRDGAERCDGPDLDGQTCLTQGYEGGELACTDSCELDLAGCTGDPELVCGDGIRSGDEECDGEDLDGQDCASRTGGQGQLFCAIDCRFDESACAPSEPDVGMDLGGADTGGDGGSDAGMDAAMDVQADAPAEPPPNSPSTDEGCQISRYGGPAPWIYLFQRGRFP